MKEQMIQIIDGPHAGLEMYGLKTIEDDAMYIVNNETDELCVYKVTEYSDGKHVGEHVWTIDAIRKTKRMAYGNRRVD